ncbi:MAG: hypothetical protein U0136_21030 [Bdellovibrionota bacterium]
MSFQPTAQDSAVRPAVSAMEEPAPLKAEAMVVSPAKLAVEMGVGAEDCSAREEDGSVLVPVQQFALCGTPAEARC